MPRFWPLLPTAERGEMLTPEPPRRRSLHAVCVIKNISGPPSSVAEGFLRSLGAGEQLLRLPPLQRQPADSAASCLPSILLAAAAAAAAVRRSALGPPVFKTMPARTAGTAVPRGPRGLLERKKKKKQ